MDPWVGAMRVSFPLAARPSTSIAPGRRLVEEWSTRGGRYLPPTGRRVRGEEALHGERGRGDRRVEGIVID